MFAAAVSIGIYSYILFSLGLVGYLNAEAIITSSLIFAVSIALYAKGDLKKIHNFKKIDILKKINKADKLSLFLIGIVVIQAGVNIIGALGPELGFDALWYHLTLPKLYTEYKAIFYIPGGLLYYSVMPKLVDLLYIPALMLNGEVIAKIVHFSFGILSTVALYKLSRKFLTQTLALLVVVIFYANLVVAWQSITAYIDLGRTFFEIMALWGFVNFANSNSKKWLIESAVMLGLAVASKLIALATLPVFLILVAFHKSRTKEKIKNSVLFSAVTLLMPLPYFIFSYTHTGNPVYPLFTNIYPIPTDHMLSIQQIIGDLIQTFLFSQDPINPIYIILVPLIFLFKNRIKGTEKVILIYSVFALLFWLLTPRTGGGRFILPYLPAFSVLAGITISKIRSAQVKHITVAAVICIACISIAYRAVANAKYLPLVTNQESKHEFLVNNLNFEFGDFYDTTNYFKKNLTENDTVLIYGVHNLYYVNFQFIHESYAKNGDEFNYVLVGRDGVLPKRFEFWNKVYENQEVGVELYTNNKRTWVY